MDVTTFYPLIRFEAFGLSDFLGFFGGVMGLIAGISVFSIIEIALTLIKSVQINCQNSKVGTKKNSRKRFVKKFLINRDHLLYRLSRIFVEFLRESSIHGVHYLNDKATGLKMKVFWFFAIAASTICCSILVYNSSTELQSNSMFVALDEKIWNVEKAIFQ